MESDLNYNSAIFEWNLTQDEIEAYKIAVIYDREYRKSFICDGESIRRNTLPKRGDPRKSSLFKHCWKLRRETRGLLENDDYLLYIQANLHILKVHNAYVAPNSICGDKAWIRYRVWKRHYDKKKCELASVLAPPSVSTTNPKIILEIDRTKKFLFERCEGRPTYDKLNEFYLKGFFRLWVMSGKVSQYYVVLSPCFAKMSILKEFADKCGFSLEVIEEKITEEIRCYFKSEFEHEWI